MEFPVEYNRSSHLKSIVPFIIGVDGLIGNALWQTFRSAPNAYGTSRKNTDHLPFFDLGNPSLDSLKIDFSRFTHLLLTAAIPNIRQCEIAPTPTRLCNLTHTLELAKQFGDAGVKPVLFSTDYVFDGKDGGYSEIDLPNPLNQYGFQKAEMEKQLPILCPNNYLIVRLTKVIQRSSNQGFIGEITGKLLQGQLVHAARDQIFQPIFLSDVIQGVIALMNLGVNGIYNLGGSETWSRYELAIEIAKHLKADKKWVNPISLDDLNEPFKRPKNTTLDHAKFDHATGLRNRNLSSQFAEIFSK